jgi:hypothetical protein
MIIQDRRQKIVDAPFWPILRMGQRVCCPPFYIQWRRIHSLWMDPTMQPSDCWMGNTIHRSSFVDPHLPAHLRLILTVIECSIIQSTKLIQTVLAACILFQCIYICFQTLLDGSVPWLQLRMPSEGWVIVVHYISPLIAGDLWYKIAFTGFRSV